MSPGGHRHLQRQGQTRSRAQPTRDSKGRPQRRWHRRPRVPPVSIAPPSKARGAARGGEPPQNSQSWDKTAWGAQDGVPWVLPAWGGSTGTPLSTSFVLQSPKQAVAAGRRDAVGQVPAFKNLRFVFPFFFFSFFFHKTVKLFPQSIAPGRRRTPPKENNKERKEKQHQKNPALDVWVTGRCRTLRSCSRTPCRGCPRRAGSSGR